VTNQPQGQLHTYNAAGNQVSFYEEEWSGPADNWVFHQNTINQTYEASGQPGKRIETRHNEDVNGTVTNTVTTTYYLRSSVLGGVSVAEIDQSGGQREGHVYVGGEKIADFGGWAPYGSLSFRQVNPTTGNWLTTQTNASAERTELDPLGATVGTYNPYLTYASYSTILENNPLYYELGNPFNLSEGCPPVDGMPVGCAWLRQSIESGAVASEDLGTWVNSRSGARVHRQEPIRNFGAGLFGIYLPDRSRGNDQQWDLYLFSFGEPQNTPTKTAEQQKCDDKIAGIFGGHGAVAAANSFEPVGGNPKSSGTFRGTGQDISDRAIHIYGNGAKNVNTGVYLPGKITGAIYPNPQTLDEYKGGSFVAFYSNLNGLKNVSLIVTHLAGFTANSRQQNDAGSRYVGTTGGKGAEDEDYLHAHLELVEGRVRRFHSTVAMKHYSFAEVFCK
jgi:hypothetical protein